MCRSTEEQDSAGRLGKPVGLPKRWSTQPQAAVVLRLPSGVRWVTEADYAAAGHHIVD